MLRQRRTLLEQQLCDQFEAALDQGTGTVQQDWPLLASFCDTRRRSSGKWIDAAADRCSTLRNRA